jgi:hypothetical protein
MTVSKWEKLSTITNFISGIVIAVLAIYLTQINADLQVSLTEKQISQSRQQGEAAIRLSNQQTELTKEQSSLAKMQTLATFLPYIRNSQSQEEKKYAIAKIEEFLGDSEVALLSRVYPNEKTLKEATGKAFAQVSEAIAPAGIAGETKVGWIYLGEYSKGVWKKKYIDIGKNISPSSIMNNIVKVNEGQKINVRENKPDSLGRMANVQGVIDRDASIKVIDIQEWFNTGFMWARVEYKH